MNRRHFLAALPATALASCGPAAEPPKVAVQEGDWPWWRGPTRDGTAPKQTVPTEWSKDKNVVWEAAVPGKGHGSPCVVSERVFLATADPEAETQSVVCFDRKTGKQLWLTEVHKGRLVKGGNAKSSHASATPACDGHRVYINFTNADAVRTTCLDL
ncbi:MAG: PQQ-like beta-propeller repeat protein, partial [Gemmataceae bacterium]|nr:PQQ-like beta-propeller repeat protein [Gemmataceae bacterium]